MQQRHVAEWPQGVVEGRIAGRVDCARVERQAGDGRGRERVKEVPASHFVTASPASLRP
jgi:hypothetical protein